MNVDNLAGPYPPNIVPLAAQPEAQPETVLTPERIKAVWWDVQSRFRNNPDPWWLQFANALLAAAKGTK